jgi:dihydroorotase
MRWVIQHGRLIDPTQNLDRISDLYIAEGRILGYGAKPDGFMAEQTIDAKGKVVVPGLIDLSTRLREPGQEHKGTIASETRAAAAGGITTLCVPPDTTPIIESPAVAELITRHANDAGFARVLPLGALTAGLKGEHLAEMALLHQQGKCVAVSNACRPVSQTRVMRRAMEYAASCGLPVFLHAEDRSLSQGGCAHEGVVSTRLGLPGVPEAAETVAVARELMLIEQSGVRAHFCHLSAAHSVQMIARAKHDGLPVTMGVTPHHLHLTEMDIGFFNSQCHVLPPLRTQRDQEGLRTGLGNGCISVISSDHQPHDADAKLAPFADTEPGISGLETLLPLGLRLVHEGVISLMDLIARLTCEPARILSLADSGSLAVGARADICIFDPEQHWTVVPDQLVSAGKNTPFAGWELTGKVTHTLLEGKLVYTAN